ncbi:MAG TPA: cytochrome c peroxidase [Oligoflexus sp.]|uniref:cytochrome-c peroxidase n=1 Tax=Oligoflexus sp. TaxID=1971216 RepID=UPI002D7FCC8F|nr:cytochrome c peroxidase [Oligoflexus sp.]HET9240649.1 cytochrome c peroxidase [Oligoflexus sp.]
MRLVRLFAAFCFFGPGFFMSVALSQTPTLRYPQLGPVPLLPEWKDNPATEAKKALGRLLFSERRLSGSGQIVCGTCHPSNADFQSNTPLDLPDRSYPHLAPALHRNAPSLLNIVYAPMLRWDGSHFTDLADAMVLPLAEANMNLTKGIPASDPFTIHIPSAQETLKERLTRGELRGYLPLYREAFGVDPMNLSQEEIWRLTGQALAVFIRIAVSRDAAFDRWNAGDDTAIPEAAKRGAELFVGKARCVACHSGPFFSDFKFHNISSSPPNAEGARADEGRYTVTGLEKDRGAFLTPTLRSVARSSPYFHNGSQTRLVNVIRHKTGENARKDPLHDPILAQTTALSDADINDLVAFLKTLDGKPLPKDEISLPLDFPNPIEE